MKRINKIFGLSLSLAAVFGLASCSNEVGEPANTPNQGSDLQSVKLVKTPDVVAYSGSTTYGGTKSSWWSEEDHKYYYQHDEEVEVNLSVNDTHDKYDVADLIAKLSIHVRNASNVTVTLPIPAAYLVESDDLYIFNQHFIADKEHKGAYGTELIAYLVDEEGNKLDSHTTTYNVPVGEDEDGKVITKPVSLTISFEDQNVVVTTNGVDEDVLEACLDYNHDGMNFEVYLYLQAKEVSAEEGDEIAQAVVESEEEAGEEVDEKLAAKNAFKEALDYATVSFTGTPKYYINSFGYEYNAEGKHTLNVNPFDCTVSLVEALENSYDLVANPEETRVEHLNGTPYNYIYLLKGDGIVADHAHGGIYVDDPNAKEEEDGND